MNFDQGSSDPSRMALAGVKLLLTFTVLSLSAPGLTQTIPSQLVVEIPDGTNNAGGAAIETCTITSGTSTCTGTFSGSDVEDDIFLTSITFGST
ncbi:MAG: hypothetical protein AAGJ52_10155, partial [Pseudomonadota bacterium]